MNSEGDMSAIILPGSSDDDIGEEVAENKQRVRDLMLMIEYQDYHVALIMTMPNVWVYFWVG
jgi:hypothetical protein